MHYNQLNEYMNCKKSVFENVKVGMTATKFVGTDRYAMVVTEVITPKKIRVARMLDNDYNSEKFKDDNGVEYLSSAAMKNYFEFTEDYKNMKPIGSVYTFRKNYRWMQEGSNLWETGAVHVGHAETYLDPNF